MIDSENIYKCLGFIVMIVLVIVFICRCMRLQLRVVEGLITRSSNSEEEDTVNSVANLAQQVLDKAQEIEDKLLLEKYKSDYEDLIINTDAMLTVAQLEQLKLLASQSNSRNHIQYMMHIVGMDFTKTALDNMMKNLDKKPSSGIGGSGGSGGGGGFF